MVNYTNLCIYSRGDLLPLKPRCYLQPPLPPRLLLPSSSHIDDDIVLHRQVFFPSFDLVTTLAFVYCTIRIYILLYNTVYSNHDPSLSKLLFALRPQSGNSIRRAATEDHSFSRHNNLLPTPLLTTAFAPAIFALVTFTRSCPKTWSVHQQ